jgi:hypothetical protein
MMGSAYAQSNLPACQGVDPAKWNNCYGTHVYQNGAKHVGEYQGGKFHGQGTLTSPIGWKYEGEFRNGFRYGQGTHIDKDGNKYVGAFIDGKEHGNGVLTFTSGNKYVGDFRDGKRNGQGTYTFASGNKFIGEFRNEKYDGQGTFYSANGSILQQGTWADGKLIRSEPIQEASISNNASSDKNNATNLPACQGSDISRWTNCFGTRAWNNGQKYVGAFKDGNYHGQGTFYAANGLIIHQGIWTNGSFGSGQVQLATTPNIDRENFRADAEETKRKNAEQEQLRLSQNQSPSLPVTTPFMGKRLALVIGNQAYNVRPLLNPRNDADDMSRALKNAGFEVIDVRDASLSQMRNAVRQFGDRLLTRDVGLVYYSGHGIEVRGRNYFIPVNADIKRSDEIADQSLDVNLILEKMETAKKGVNILIVDACRDDPFGRSFRSSSRGLANMDAPQGTIIAFATSPGKVAADGSGRNSPYTKNLVKMMQVPNLPIEQVFKQVRRAVQEETRNQQTPWENTSLSGDFYFSVKK